jgi:hypothetical protein
MEVSHGILWFISNFAKFTHPSHSFKRGKFSPKHSHFAPCGEGGNAKKLSHTRGGKKKPRSGFFGESQKTLGAD